MRGLVYISSTAVSCLRRRRKRKKRNPSGFADQDHRAGICPTPRGKGAGGAQRGPGILQGEANREQLQSLGEFGCARAGGGPWGGEGEQREGREGRDRDGDSQAGDSWHHTALLRAGGTGGF